MKLVQLFLTCWRVLWLYGLGFLKAGGLGLGGSAEKRRQRRVLPKPGQSIEYWDKGMDTKLGGLWIASKIKSEKTKVICGLSITYYEVTSPAGSYPDTSAVETWQIRANPSYKELGSGFVEAGTKVEVKVEVTVAGIEPFEAWAMASVASDSRDTAELKLVFANSDFWKEGSYRRHLCRIAPESDPSTLSAWGKDPRQPLICNLEPHIPQQLEIIAAKIRDELAPSLDTLTVYTFEPYREELNDIADTLITARRYAKALTVVRLIWDIEKVISKNNSRSKTTPSNNPLS